MSGYTKLFGSILESTVWMESPPVKVVWITLLAMADRDGVIEASVPGLAKRAGVDRAHCEQALSIFLAPDPDSRTPDFDGRRIEAVPGGWRLLNHGIYRERASRDEAREKAAARQRLKRERDAAKSRLSREVTNVTQSHDIAEAPPPPPASSVQKHARAFSASPSLVEVPDDITARASQFVQHTYPDLYRKHRKGARYISKPNLDFLEAIELCKTWDDDRLTKLAIVFLTTDHQFAENGSRTMAQFRSMASWCDSRLAEAGIA